MNLRRRLVCPARACCPSPAGVAVHLVAVLHTVADQWRSQDFGLVGASAGVKTGRVAGGDSQCQE